MVQKNFRIETIHNAFNYDILITTYSLLRNDINDYVNIKFNTIILDEAQNIKNYNSQNSIAAKSLKAKNKFALTGTPIENSLLEFWSIIYKNINKTQRVRKLEKKLSRQQKRLSRKYESLKLRNKKEKGEAIRQNIQKQIAKVQILYQGLNNIRTDYINKVVSNVVRNKPSYITIEYLNVKGMMRNKHLSKAVAQQKFNEFRNKLATKCNAFGIELRIVDRFYPSSKLCHKCGSIKKDLKLKDRIFNCDCGYVEDRDYNASLNLRDAKIYKTA